MSSGVTKSLLWEVSNNGLIQESYFIGTMHLMCAEDAVLSSNAKVINSKVEQVYLEADLEDMSELLFGEVSIKMPEPITLSELLHEEEYEEIRNFFELHQPHISFDILAQQQPLMLSSSLYDLFLPCENKNGIDIRILEEARRYNIITKGLETIAFQASLFDKIPCQEQAKELLRTIRNIDKYEQLLNTLLEVYKAQDIEKLHHLTTKEEAGISSFTNLLVYDRNRNWVEQFEDIAQKKSTLFAVGAAHLGGEEGVINLLKQKGYTLRPIPNLF